MSEKRKKPEINTTTKLVSSASLFKRKEFEGLSKHERIIKAKELGWRLDVKSAKYYQVEN